MMFCANISFSQQHVQDKKLQKYYEQQFSENIKKQLDKIDWSHVERTTQGDTVLYTIPVVVHVLHSYGIGWVADTTIINCIQSMNTYLLMQRADTALIIPVVAPIVSFV
jgi:hypothetical protein